MNRAPADPVRENFGRDPIDLRWWWGVWQGERLVGFGAGYPRKSQCFKHQRECLERASRDNLSPVPCTNPVVRPR